jgi:hypothetical protein
MTHVNFDDDDIGVRDWRPKPPLRLRAKRKLQIRWCRVKCTRCPHMRAVAIAPSIIRWGDYARQQAGRRADAGCGDREGAKRRLGRPTAAPKDDPPRAYARVKPRSFRG